VQHPLNNVFLPFLIIDKLSCIILKAMIQKFVVDEGKNRLCPIAVKPSFQLTYNEQHDSVAAVKCSCLKIEAVFFTNHSALSTQALPNKTLVL
jgi:hypothetical protein